MTEPESVPQPEGAAVYVISYDEERNEVFLLPAELEDDEERTTSRDFEINEGQWRIERIKHGPLIATESRLRGVNVGSLGRAIEGNRYGTMLLVDRSAPPIDEEVLDIEKRYEMDIKDDSVVAAVTQRYPTRPTQTPAEVKATRSRVAAAYDCWIEDVNLLLAKRHVARGATGRLARR